MYRKMQFAYFYKTAKNYCFKIIQIVHDHHDLDLLTITLSWGHVQLLTGAYGVSHLMEILMFVLSVIISELFKYELCMPFNLWPQGQM